MVAFGDSAANPPEVNYATLMAGDHGASATAAAAAHQALADTLATTMGLMEGNAASTAAGGWQGVGGVSMLANATEMTGVMSMAVAWLQEGSMLAAQIVDAYTLALESMIPAEVCTTNRGTWQGLVDTNWIGQNTPGIIALDLEYFGHFWTQNASLMAGYQAVVSAALAALATPPPLNPAFANPAGPLAGVVQAGAQTAAGSLQSGFQGVSQTAETAAGGTQAPASAATDGLSQAMSMPMQMVGQLSQLPQMAGQLPQMLGQAPQLLSQAVQLPMGMLGSAGQRRQSRGRRRAGGCGQHRDPVAGGHVDRRRGPRRWRRHRQRRQRCRAEQFHQARKQFRHPEHAEASRRLHRGQRRPRAGRRFGGPGHGWRRPLRGPGGHGPRRCADRRRRRRRRGRCS